MGIILKTTELTRSFKGQTAVNRISLIEKNSVYGLLGPNGAGKSTILKKDERISEVLTIVQLTNMGKKKAGQFSLGMKQRPGIALISNGKPGCEGGIHKDADLERIFMEAAGSTREEG